METKNKKSKKEMTLISASSLFTVLGLLLFDDNQIIKFTFLILAVALAFYAAILTKKNKEKKSQQE